MANQVLTGALALIKSNGIVIGRTKSIQFSEEITRGQVVGLGELLRQEVPALGHRGTGSISSYAIDYETDGLPENFARKVESVQEFVDSLILNEEGVQLVIFKKVADFIDPTTKIVRSTPKVYATINKVFLNRKGMNINESQIAGVDQSFDFLEPIIFNN